MADEMVAGEQQEDQALQQILQLCQSGQPEALQEIAKIVQGLLSHNQEEEQQMAPEAEAPKEGSREAMVAAVKNQMGE